MAKKINEHADYINKNYAGGLKEYNNLQNIRYQTALQNNDTNMTNKLLADASKVGYSLNGTPATRGSESYTPTEPTLRNNRSMAKQLGLDFDEQSILNKFNQTTKDQYSMLNKEYNNTANKFYDQMYGQQSTALDTIRKSQAQAVATGASRGLQMSNELSSMLGLQQESVANATQLSQDRNLLKDKEAAAYSLNAKTAMDTYNALATQMGTQAANIYSADVQNNVGLMSYYAALDEAQKNLQGTVYGADKNLEGNKYTADQNLSGTRYNADQNLIGSKFAAQKSYDGQIGAANINAGATMGAARLNNATQQAYYKSLSAQQGGATANDLGSMLNNAKSQDEYVGYLVSLGVSESTAKQFWTDKNKPAVKQEVKTLINNNFPNMDPNWRGGLITDPNRK